MFVRRTGSFASDLRTVEAIRPELELARAPVAKRTESALVARRVRELRKIFKSGGNTLLSKEARYHLLKPFQVRKPSACGAQSICGDESLAEAELSKSPSRRDRPKHLISAYYTDRRLRLTNDTSEYSDAFMKEILSGGELTWVAYQMNIASSKGWRRVCRAEKLRQHEASGGRPIHWILDSGANAWLVPMYIGGKLNPCITKIYDRKKDIGTAAGPAVATVVEISTPFGLRRSSAIDRDVPHLCPMSDVVSDGFLYWMGNRMPIFKYRGKVVPLQLCYGIPYIWTVDGKVVKPSAIGKPDRVGESGPETSTPQLSETNSKKESAPESSPEIASLAGTSPAPTAESNKHINVNDETTANFISQNAKRKRKKNLTVRFSEIVQVRPFCKYGAAKLVADEETCDDCFEDDYDDLTEGVRDDDVHTTRAFTAIQLEEKPRRTKSRRRRRQLNPEVEDQKLRQAVEREVPGAVWKKIRAKLREELEDGADVVSGKKNGIVQDLPRGDCDGSRIGSASREMDDLAGAVRSDEFNIALNGVEAFPMFSSDSEDEGETSAMKAKFVREVGDTGIIGVHGYMAYLGDSDRLNKRWDDGVREMEADLKLNEFCCYMADLGDPHLLDHEPFDPKCPACLRAKAKVKGQRKVDNTDLKREEKATVPGERQIVDLCGPFPNSPQQHNFMFVGVDDATGCLFVMPLRGKTPAAVAVAIATFKSEMDEFRKFRQLPQPLVWRLKSDLGSEFTSKEASKFVGETSGTQEFVPKSRHVARVELAIQKISKGTRALLSQAGLPAKLWPYAALTYVHNFNIEAVPGWAEFLEHHEKLSERVIFGELGFVKLGDDMQALSKSAEKGAPVCYLGPCQGMRKSCNIVYVAAKGKGPGKYHHTTCLHDAIKFPKTSSERSFAFKRVYNDLVTISAPGETFGKLGAGVYAEEPTMAKSDKGGPMEVSKPPHSANKKNAGPDVWWRRPNSTCIACRGKARVHTFEGDDNDNKIMCRWSGLDNKKLKILRKEGAGCGSQIDKEVLMERVAEKIACEDMSWKDAFKWYKDEVKAAKEQKAIASFFRALSEIAPDRDKETMRHSLFMARYAGEFAKSSSERSTHEDCDGCDEDIDMASLTQAYTMDSHATRKKWCDIIDEIDSSLLTDKDRAVAINDSHFSRWDDEIQHYIRCDRGAYVKWGGDHDSSVKAYVTRNMTKLERTSGRGKAALTDELLKVIDKGTFGRPANGHLMAKLHPNATVSGLCMLASVKHAEKVPELQKMKGRIVVLGNKIFLMGSGKETFPKGKDFGLHGDVASLAAFRAVAFHSTRKDYVLESADVANAYLNAPWPQESEKHFLRVDRQIYELLPEDWKQQVNEAGGPGVAVLPMEKCLYGHPLSGFLWIQQMHDFLLSEHCGFEMVPGAKALYKKGNVLVCVYVDDLAVAGPRDEVDKLWDALSSSRGGRYDLREVGECTEFLGVQVKRRKVEHGSEVELSMKDYCGSIVKNYEELYQDELQQTRVDDDEEDRRLQCYSLDGSEACRDCEWRQFFANNDTVNCGSATHGRGDPESNDSKPKSVCAYCANCARAGRGDKDRSCVSAHVAEEKPQSPAAAVKTGTAEKSKAKKMGVRPRLVPMSPEQDESIREQHLWTPVPPQKRVMKLVGQLLWVARCTRTDVAYPVSRLASGISRWRDEHVKVMSQVVGYLKRTADMALRFTPGDPSLRTSLELHTDASWHTPRSQSGCVLVAVQYPNPDDRDSPRVLGLIDWLSTKQGLTADSSASSELISAHTGVRTCLPLAQSLNEFWRLNPRQIAIRIDNKAVIDVARSGSTKGLTWMAPKPFGIRAGCLHDLHELGVITPEFIGTEGQLSDLNTKALAKLKLGAILEKLGLVEPKVTTTKKSKSKQVDTASNVSVACHLLSFI